MKPYQSQAEIVVYAESDEAAELAIEKALRGVEGFDYVSFDSTVSIADEEDDDEAT